VRIALDTNRYRDLTDGDQDVVATIETADDVFVPFVVLAELRGGFAVGRKGRENERHLLRFLSKPGVAVLSATDATTHVYADLYRQLRRQATPIPTHDLWIAALVTQHSMVLLSRDEHFDRLPQIHRI
jgi:predicted nucleic acid-binding protein